MKPDPETAWVLRGYQCGERVAFFGPDEASVRAQAACQPYRVTPYFIGKRKDEK